MEEFIAISLNICNESNVCQILDLLEILKDCNRFSLTMAIISMSKGYSAENLFKKLLTLSRDNFERDRVKLMCKEYKIEQIEETLIE